MEFTFGILKFLGFLLRIRWLGVRGYFLSLEIFFGNFLWKFSLEIFFGNSLWEFSLEILFGNSLWEF